MALEEFVEWAFDNARTVDERCTVELLVEQALHQWHVRHKTGRHERWELAAERGR